MPLIWRSRSLTLRLAKEWRDIVRFVYYPIVRWEFTGEAAHLSVYRYFNHAVDID